MTDNHPITPPPELVREWTQNRGYSYAYELWNYLAAQAAQWGADQELEACCEWMRDAPFGLSLNTSAYQLRDARRPKPPSLKEQALAVLDDCSDRLDSAHENTIRRALEALPE